MNNFFLWLELVSTLASTVAHKNGKDVDTELAYLNLLTKGMEVKSLTDAKLMELRTLIQVQKSTGQVPSAQDLEDLSSRILMRSEEIQEGGK